MKNLPSILTLFLTFSIGCIAAEQKQESPEDFIQSWAKAFDKNDPAVISKFYEPSKDLEMLVSVGSWYHGFDQMVKAYTTDSKEIRYYDSTIKKLRIRRFENTAIVGFEHLFKFEVLNSEEHVQVHIRTTSTLRWMEGKWLIVLEHSSPIKDQERAVLIPKIK